MGREGEMNERKRKDREGVGGEKGEKKRVRDHNVVYTSLKNKN